MDCVRSPSCRLWTGGGEWEQDGQSCLALPFLQWSQMGAGRDAPGPPVLCRAWEMVVLIMNSGYLGEKRPRWGTKEMLWQEVLNMDGKVRTRQGRVRAERCEWQRWVCRDLSYVSGTWQDSEKFHACRQIFHPPHAMVEWATSAAVHNLLQLLDSLFTQESECIPYL